MNLYQNFVNVHNIAFLPPERVRVWRRPGERSTKYLNHIVQNILTRHIIQVLDWPPKSPDLNPIENFALDGSLATKKHATRRGISHGRMSRSRSYSKCYRKHTSASQRISDT